MQTVSRITVKEALARNRARRVRIAISGTYSTGKTTTTYALARLTGLSRTHARTMREILPQAFPGKRLEDCTPPELFELGIRRYVERAVHESRFVDGFLSDGSSLHEWVYGKTRMEIGTGQGGRLMSALLRQMLAGPRIFSVYRTVIARMGAVVKDHACQSYDDFVHLPVEFPLSPDGHRPVSERFRHHSDTLLTDTLQELGIPYRIFGGSLDQRLGQILEYYELWPVTSIASAMDWAQEQVRGLHRTLEIARKRAG